MTLIPPAIISKLLSPLKLAYFILAVSLPIFMFSCKKTKIATDDIVIEKTNRKITARNLSEVQQKKFYATLSPSEKCTEWREHLKEVLGLPKKYFSFNNAQLSYLSDLIRYTLKPSLFENPTSKSAWATLDSCRDLAKKLFDRPTGRILFSSLTILHNANSRFDGASDQFSEPDLNATVCDCNLASDWCFGFSKCSNNGNKSCNTVDDCGLFWRYTCNGLCQ